MLERLVSRFPGSAREHLAAIADVWSAELNQIMRRMLELSREDVAELPIEVRPEAIFELAKLGLWMEERIVQVKTASVAIHDIDPSAEAQSAKTPSSIARIENTARILAENVWNKLCARWWKRHPALADSKKTRRKLIVPNSVTEGVARQHFSPESTNVRWAISGRVRVYSRSVSGSVTSEDLPPSQWGRAKFLYSQALERYLALVEGDAGSPYKKLLETVPLTETDRRHWIAFLACQIFRTPACMARMMPRMRAFLLQHRHLNFPATLRNLRAAHETLFTNNRVFASSYRLICGRRWRMLRAPGNASFVRSDDPVLIRGSVAVGNWELVYPMSPRQCFVAGPERVPTDTKDMPDVVPEDRELNRMQTDALNTAIASTARRTLLATTSTDDSQLRSILEPCLGGRWDSLAQSMPGLVEFWGDISNS